MYIMKNHSSSPLPSTLIIKLPYKQEQHDPLKLCFPYMAIEVRKFPLKMYTKRKFKSTFSQLNFKANKPLFRVKSQCMYPGYIALYMCIRVLSSAGGQGEASPPNSSASLPKLQAPPLWLYCSCDCIDYSFPRKQKCLDREPCVYIHSTVYIIIIHVCINSVLTTSGSIGVFVRSHRKMTPGVRKDTNR